MGFFVSASYDLHAHTLHSDGTLSPSELVARAHANGVGALAVTDHDVTDGIQEAQAAAEQLPMRVIPGVEISVTWQRQTIHVLGLCIDIQHEPLQKGLEGLRSFRHWRAHEIDRKLRKKNIDGAFDSAREIARGAVISRTHFARFLVSRGYVPSMGQAFRQYLGRGKSAYVPGQWADLHDALKWIRGAGGIAVVAHPGRYQLTASKLRRLLNEFKECGGTAIEVASGNQTAAQLEHLTRVAVDLDLLGSCGSDYHGPEKAWVDLGKLPPITAPVVPVWSRFTSEYTCRPLA